MLNVKIIITVICVNLLLCLFVQCENNEGGDLISESNRLQKVEYDYNLDGEEDKMYTYDYDGYGNRVAKHFDENGDGIDDSITTYEYNAQHLLSVMYRDSNADGNSDGYIEYEYDDHSRLATETKYASNGAIMTVTTYEYDGFHFLLKEIWDNYFAGSYYNSDVITHENNVSGCRIRTSRDAGADEVIDSEIMYEFANANSCKLQKVLYDNDFDGNIDESVTYESYGSIVHTMNTLIDENYDGNIDEIHTYENIGLIRKVYIDYDADTITDAIVTAHYSSESMSYFSYTLGY